MPEIKPLKLKDLGGGDGQLREFESGDKIAAALLALEAWATAATPDAALTELQFTAVGKALAKASDPAAGRTALGLGSAATRSALGASGALYSRDSILGPVSQSGGVPTGAIIERGSNANGEYVRWADGTQICWITTNLTCSGNASAPAQHYLPLPAGFPSGSGTSTIAGIAYPVSDNALTVLRCTSVRAGATQALVELVATPAQVLVVNLEVFGRWY